MIAMLVELCVAVAGNVWVEVSVIGVRADIGIDVLTDVLIKILTAVIVCNGIGAMLDLEAVVATSALDLELVVPWSYVVEVIPDDWVEAAIDIDVSIDRRVNKSIGVLARV